MILILFSNIIRESVDLLAKSTVRINNVSIWLGVYHSISNRQQPLLLTHTITQCTPYFSLHRVFSSQKESPSTQYTHKFIYKVLFPEWGIYTLVECHPFKYNIITIYNVFYNLYYTLKCSIF